MIDIILAAACFVPWLIFMVWWAWSRGDKGFGEP